MGFLENVSQFFSKLFSSLLSLIKILILSRRSTVKSSKRSKDLLVLGNGPSVKSQFDKIKLNRDKFDLLCVNNFPNTDYYSELKPDYFVVISEEFWNNDTTIDQNKQTRYEILEALINKTNWPIQVFIPVKSRKNKTFIKQITSNQHIQLKFINPTPIDGFTNFSNWCFKMNLGMPRPHNVLIPSIIVGINCGYQTLFLFGADHSWLPEISVDENNNALISQKHFYKSVMDKKAHMYKKGQSPRKLHEILHKFMVSFRAYHIIDKYAKQRNVKVYNATVNSFIDAFDRRGPYESWESNS